MPRPKFATMDEYIASFPKEIQAILQNIRKAVHESAPQAVEAMSYGMPTFKLNGNLVHFAAFKNHIGFFPTSSGIAAFREELSAYKLSTGTVQFPLGRPIPFGLVKKIVRFRVRENLAKKRR